MITPFRQPIHPRQKGADVWAVKRALIRMKAKGSRTMKRDRYAGDAFVTVIKMVQHNHGLKVDGVYGAKTHAIVAPHMDAWGRFLYRTATIRKVVPVGAQAAAKRLLELHVEGKYHADNPGDMRDIINTAAGRPVFGALGYVRIDARVLELLVWLIDVEGYRIGTYAICSDHRYDGHHGHVAGYCVDISSVNGVSIASGSSRDLTLSLARTLHKAPSHLQLRQEITGGYGNRRDWTITACSITAPRGLNPDAYYGSLTMSEHCNHIHCGY